MVLAAGSDRFTGLAKEIDRLRQALAIPGLSMAVVRSQEAVFARGFGRVDLERQIPTAPDTPYQIDSLTKPFAAAVLMKLAEQGRLNLDDRIAKFDAAMDRDAIVSAPIKALMFAPARSNAGERLPCGLGWIIQESDGHRLVWHNGHAPDAHSSLFFKVPATEHSLILLANSGGASGPFDLTKGNLLDSPFARSFLHWLA